jgi:hypothetical protein
VYNAHRSQSDKWADELIFLVCVLVPVYGIATFADAIVFNSVEFWTGENPIEMSKVVKQGSEEVAMSKGADSQIAVASKGSNFSLERSDRGVTAKDSKGNVIFSSKTTEDGGIAIYDSHDQLVKNYSADEVAAKKQDYIRN